MPKDPKGKPERRGEKGGPCPDCGSPTVARVQPDTGKLYFAVQTMRAGVASMAAATCLEDSATRI